MLNDDEKKGLESGQQPQYGFVLVEPEAVPQEASIEQSATPEQPVEPGQDIKPGQPVATGQQPQYTGYQFWEQNIQNTQNNQSTEHAQPDMSQDLRQETHVQPLPPKKKPFWIKVVQLVAVAAIFGIVAGACFTGVNYLYDKVNPNRESSQAVIGSTSDAIDKTSVISSTKVLDGNGSDGDVSDIVANAMPSIVSISSTVSQPYMDFFGNTYDNEAEGSGSGIIVGKNDTELLIATNNHVVTGAKKINVTFINNDVLTATIKGTDTSADLAIVAVNLKDIKEDTMKAIKIATLGDSDKAKVGEKVLAIGNALGYGQSLTVGYISAKNRVVDVENNKMTLLQTDAAINPGNSGGALINMQGEVIGINSAKLTANAVEGMGYAIPISSATPIFNELMNRETVKAGDEGYLGIMGRDVTESVAQMYNMPLGAFVSEVTAGGSAEKAGILSGDIITAVNGMSTNNMDSVKEKVNSYAAGTEVVITIQRRDGGAYAAQDIKVTLQKKPKETANSQKPIELPENDDDTTIVPKNPFGYEFIPQE